MNPYSSVKQEQPLVSVIVVTYNSSKTVVETLDSVKNQTYSNIELVITDDNSKDNTKNIVDLWLRENERAFANVVKVYSDVNTGPASNVNRGITASKGEYIKAMSGDDCLKSDCVEKCISFLIDNDIQFCISDVEIFSDNADTPVPKDKIDSYKRCFELCKEPREKKLKRLAYQYVLLSPGYFYSRKVYEKAGGFDNRFPFSEEVPFAMRILKSGYDMCPLEEKLVLYRYSGESLSQHHGKKLGNRRWFEDNRRIFYAYQLSELLKSFRLVRALGMFINYEQTNLMYFNSLWAKIGSAILCVLNPFTYVNVVYRWKHRK